MAGYDLPEAQPGESARKALSARRLTDTARALKELDRRLLEIEGGRRGRRQHNNRRPRFQVWFEVEGQKLHVSEGTLVGGTDWVEPIVPQINGEDLTADPAPGIDCTGKDATKKWRLVVAIFPSVAKVELVDADVSSPTETAGADLVWVLADIEFEDVGAGVLAMKKMDPVWNSDIPAGAGWGGWGKGTDPFEIVVSDDKMRVLPGCAGGFEYVSTATKLDVKVVGDATISLGETTLTESIWVGLKASYYMTSTTVAGKSFNPGVRPPCRELHYAQWGGFQIVTSPIGTPFVDGDGDAYKVIGKVLKDGDVYTPEQILASDFDFPLVSWMAGFLDVADATQVLDETADGLILGDATKLATALYSRDPVGNPLTDDGNDGLLVVSKATVQNASAAADLAALKADFNDLLSRLKSANLMDNA